MINRWYVVAESADAVNEKRVGLETHSAQLLNLNIANLKNGITAIVKSKIRPPDRNKTEGQRISIGNCVSSLEAHGSDMGNLSASRTRLTTQRLTDAG